MANNIYFRPLTPLESFSMTQMFTLKMAQWNHSVKHDILGPISARIIGCALVAFTALADALMHTALTIGKCISGLSLFAFQFCINIPQDLNLGSSFDPFKQHYACSISFNNFAFFMFVGP